MPANLDLIYLGEEPSGVERILDRKIVSVWEFHPSSGADPTSIPVLYLESRDDRDGDNLMIMRGKDAARVWELLLRNSAE